MQSIPAPSQRIALSTPSSSRVSTTSHSSSAKSSSTQSGFSSSFNSSQHFHRRTPSAAQHATLPKPSHKPPSIFHSFKGDLKTQDIFYEILKTFNDRVKVFFPGSHDFDVIRQQLWNHDAICTPCLILQPKSNQQVSDCIKAYTTGVLKCLTENRRNGRALAVPRLSIAGGRCSNHAMKSGAIVIDMSSMRNVTVDVATQTCTVQGGARVIDLDSATAEYGLTALSGTCQALGVVGCVFGGGLGYASRKYGLACDNVVKAEIIMANGKLKRCSPDHHPDLLWSLCGGGGGIGIVVSLTLRCFPLSHGALLTYNLFTNNIDQRRSVIRKWGQWVNGDVDNTMMEGDDVLKETDGSPKEVYSQLILPTDTSRPIEFVGASIDTEIIPQSDGVIEQYMDTMKKKRGFKLFGNSGVQPDMWEKIPGLADLVDDKTGKMGAQSRSHEDFRLMGYGDGLQSHSNSYFKPGQLFISYKYASSLTHKIVEILLEATAASEISPENESRIHIMSGGGAINDAKNSMAAFDAREMNYLIMIEGKWNAVSRSREEKDKEKVIKWVHQTVNKLHRCEGIRSTVHPESYRDQVSRSGKRKPDGFYNFSEENGRRLMSIKYRRDPKKVFSLTSRISFKEDVDYASENATLGTQRTDISGVKTLKDGEVNPPECVSPPRKSLSTISVNIVRDKSSSNVAKESWKKKDKQNEMQTPVMKNSKTVKLPAIQNDSQEKKKDSIQQNNVGNIEESLSNDEMMSKSVKQLLSIADSDEDLNDWILPDVPLTTESFESDTIYEDTKSDRTPPVTSTNSVKFSKPAAYDPDDSSFTGMVSL